MPISLPGGLLLRPARPDDLDRIGALLTDRGDAADAVDHRLVMSDPDAGWSACAVVVDGDLVVSTATLLDEVVYLCGTAIPAGQVELVATDRRYEGRGLVRALMGWAHERSRQRGHLIQVLLGIPYFYRQFGYQYAVDLPATRSVTGPPPPDGGGDTVRAATAADIPAMAALQDSAQDAADLRMPHSPACWRWLVARDGSTQWMVERAGTPVATGRTTPPEEGEVALGELAALDPAAARTLLAHAAALAGDAPLTVRDRPGTVAGRALEPFLGPVPAQADRYYVRVPDAPALFEHLRPVLSRRLATSSLADAEGTALVSFFRSHVTFDYGGGAVGPVRAGGTMQAPSSAGGAGVAPDQVAPLLFGPDGIDGLAARHPDVYPGPNAGLMRVLFPPVRADLLTFYLPG